MDSLSVFGTKEFIYFLIILLTLMLLVIIPPNSYVKLSRSHSPLQNRILSLFLLPKTGTKEIKWLRKGILEGLD